jgi:GTPase SAR1 family protein
VELSRQRVMIVGPGNAGKSTLVHRLMTGAFTPNQFSMTDGVSMKDWVLKTTPEGAPVTEIHLSLWDFGGQEMYLHTHPLLFSDKTIYLLVCDPRSTTHLRQLGSYLFNIRSRAQRGDAAAAPIILITTHSSEVDDRETRRLLLDELESVDFVSHHSVDSSTGEGIEDLKLCLAKYLLGEFSSHSLVRIPRWYLEVEATIKREAQRQATFSITKTMFRSICQRALWGSALSLSPLPEHGTEDPEVTVRVDTLLYLLHQWGSVFILPERMKGRQGSSGVGDIVLDPQSLADVFKCVLTSSRATTRSNKQLFEDGILLHHTAEILWAAYEPHLRSQFLDLLHRCELAFEVFDSQGRSEDRSLVPALLRETRRLDEKQIRERILSLWPSTRDLGCIKVSFQSLLPNFFPKLMVRVRQLTSPSHLSRRSFVVHLPEYDECAGLVQPSVVCLVEDSEASVISLYPGGCSFNATAISCQAIRGLLESYSGMALRAVTFSVRGQTFSNEEIHHSLLSDRLSPFSRQPHFSLRFLSPLFDLPPCSAAVADPTLDFSFPFSAEENNRLTNLRQRCSLFERTHDACDLIGLSKALINAAPLLRQHGLGLEADPKILWLAGKVPSEEVVFLYAVSPSFKPSLSWEIVWESEVSFPMTETPSLASDGACLSALSELFLQALKNLFPQRVIPRWCPPSSPSSLPVQWVGLLPCMAHRTLLSQRERQLFAEDYDFLGSSVWYHRELLQRHRGAAYEDICTNLMPRLRGDLEEVVGEGVQAIETIMERQVGSLHERLDQRTLVD